jgi:hypothetical protein
LCKRIIPPEAEQESAELRRALLQELASNTAAVRESVSKWQELIKSGASYEEADKTFTGLPALQKIWRHIPSERTTSFLALLVASASLILQLTEHSKEQRVKPEKPWRPPPGRGQLFDDFSNGLDLRRRWRLTSRDKSDPQASRQIFVQDDKLHLHTGRADIVAQLEPKLSPNTSIRRVSVKIALVSQKGVNGWVSLVVSSYLGVAQNIITMRPIADDRAVFHYSMSAKGRTTSDFPIERGVEYLLEAVSTPGWGFHFVLTGPDMVKHSSVYALPKSKPIVIFGFEIRGGAARDRHFHVDVDEVRITYV